MEQYENNDAEIGSGYNSLAEQSVIGALMIDPDAVDKITWLTAGMFFNQAHQLIYIAVRTLIRDRQPVDIVTVAELLDSKGKLTLVGGVAYLGEIVKSTPSSANIAKYAEIVRAKFNERKLKITLSDALSQVGVGKGIPETISQAVGALTSILEGYSRGEPTSVSELLMGRLERIEKIQGGEIKPIGTGFRQFDEKFGGLQGGELVILAGRPSMGKTALGIQIGEQVQTVDAPAMVFTLEMSAGQLVDRMISGNSRVDGRRLFRENGMQAQDWDNLTVAIGNLSQSNMVIDDTALTVAEMAIKAKAQKRKGGLGIVVIDYLQLMRGENDRITNREQEISGISRGLKAMAKDLDVPVIALSQLSRKVEDRQDKRPIMSDLRESGAIEQDADMIVFVYRDEYYNPDSQYKGTAEIIMAKNRNGDTGKIFLTFEREHVRFKDHTQHFDDYDSSYNPTGFQSRNRYQAMD